MKYILRYNSDTSPNIHNGRYKLQAVVSDVTFSEVRCFSGHDKCSCRWARASIQQVSVSKWLYLELTCLYVWIYVTFYI